MFDFVYWLKFLAAMAITNSHYADIWPVSAMAFGGNIGNCIYFLVSGFCLYNIKEPIYKWYPKRILRIYPSFLIVAVLNFLVYKEEITNGLEGYIHTFIYPTRFHFIASITILYLAYYAVRVVQNKFKISTTAFIALLSAVFVGVYIFAFDKSYYHIDSVEENWCRFMFAAAMLLGAYLREKYDSVSEKISVPHICVTVVSAIAYFVLKKVFGTFSTLAALQFLSPIVCLTFVCCIAVLFIKLEKRGVFAKANKYIDKAVKFTAGITLEIYLCQMYIIGKLPPLAFPLNLIVVTVVIIVCAKFVSIAAHFIQKPFDKLFYKDKKHTEVRS